MGIKLLSFINSVINIAKQILIFYQDQFVEKQSQFSSTVIVEKIKREKIIFIWNLKKITKECLREPCHYFFNKLD